MMITNTITMDLKAPGQPEVIWGVQGDCGSRCLKVSLTDAGTDWSIPADTAVRIGYARSDGTGGWYDTLPDGTAGWQASGNVLTVYLAPQVLAVPGLVKLRLTLSQEDRQLSTFPVLLQVDVREDSAGVQHVEAGGLILRSVEDGKRYRLWISGGSLRMEEMA